MYRNNTIKVKFIAALLATVIGGGVSPSVAEENDAKQDRAANTSIGEVDKKREDKKIKIEDKKIKIKTSLSCGPQMRCVCRTSKTPPFKPEIPCSSPLEVHPYYKCGCEMRKTPED